MAWLRVDTPPDLLPALDGRSAEGADTRIEIGDVARERLRCLPVLLCEFGFRPLRIIRALALPLSADAGKRPGHFRVDVTGLAGWIQCACEVPASLRFWSLAHAGSPAFCLASSWPT